MEEKQESVNTKYENIRPYSDSELKEALKRIVKDPTFDKIRLAVFPERTLEELEFKFLSISTIQQFQEEIMSEIIKRILSKTSDGLTYTGLEVLNTTDRHLFISNHRDILLDPALLHLICFFNNLPIAQMAIGDNLITSDFIEDVARSNRMIKVLRGGSPKDIYISSTLLSEYIRNSITSQESSVWIAQRNGRTKDGNDQTEQGLLKMLDMSGGKDFAKNFNELAIIPLVISYQIETCDFLKARELYLSKSTKYIKEPGEDLKSILQGISQNKGGIHISLLEPISTAEIERCASMEKNEKYTSLAALIDNRIHKGYKLWDNNYIAYDILNDSNTYEGHYTKEAKENFIVYMESGLSCLRENEPSLDINEIRTIFLNIYAKSLVNSVK